MRKKWKFTSMILVELQDFTRLNWWKWKPLTPEAFLKQAFTKIKTNMLASVQHTLLDCGSTLGFLPNVFMLFFEICKRLLQVIEEFPDLAFSRGVTSDRTLQVIQILLVPCILQQSGHPSERAVVIPTRLSSMQIWGIFTCLNIH